MASRGWLEERGPNTFRLCVSAGMDGKGKQDIKRKTFHGRKREAQKALTAFAAEVERTYLTAGAKHSFEEFSERWLDLHAEPNLKAQTVAGYRRHLKNYIYPAIGHIKLEKLTAVRLMDFYASLQKDGIRLDKKKGGLSPVTIGQYHRIISSILESAVKWNVLSYNVAHGVQPPRAEHKEMNVYNEEQTVDMLTALEKQPIKYQALISLAVLAGLRRGECLGLEWADVDFEKQEITIRRQSQYLPHKGVFADSPKTASSVRIIAIPATLVDTLKGLKASQNSKRLKLGGRWHDSGRVFTTWDGRPMHPDSISSWFREFQTDANLPHIRFHDLRHVSATLMLVGGVDLKAVSKRLGHKQTSTTMNIYAHALRSADRQASAKMQELLDRSKGSRTKKATK